MSKFRDSVLPIKPRKYLNDRNDHHYDLRGTEVNILDHRHCIHLPDSTSVTSMFSSWGEIVSAVCMLDDPGTVQYLVLSPSSSNAGGEFNTYGDAYIRIHSIEDFSPHSTQFPTHESMEWDVNDSGEVVLLRNHPERAAYHYYGNEKTAAVRESGYQDGTPELAMLLTIAPGDWI